jgi:hypothetical protein
MNTKTIASLIFLCLASSAGAAVNFDQGVDVGSLIQQAASSDIKVPEVRFPTMTDVTKDCKRVTFRRNDPLVSPAVTLTSITSFENCTNMGFPAGMVCTHYTMPHSENVKITVMAPRELKPDQKEVFEVCLWGETLSLRPVTTVYTYTVNRVLSNLELTPAVHSAPGVAKEFKAAGKDSCMLVTDTDYSCVYRCNDGTYIANSNPFGPAPFPGLPLPLHGCRSSVPNPGPAGK